MLALISRRHEGPTNEMTDIADQSDQSVENGWTAIVLAGQRPGQDPLAAQFGETWKALVPLDGEAMLTHVLRTLHGVERIKRIVVLCQKPEALIDAVQSDGPIELVESQANISQSILNVVGGDKAPWPVLVTTADHPLLTGEMVDQFLDGAEGDLSIGMVGRKTFRKSFPECQRTWLPFWDDGFSGANLFALITDNSRRALNLWVVAESDRKAAFRLFRHFGLILSLRGITRTISLKHAFASAGQRIGIIARSVVLDDPVAAIDVDKVGDHSLATQIMAERANARRVATGSSPT